MTFNDEFDGSGDLDLSSAPRNWRFETMNDGLHRGGNTSLDASGNPVESWYSVNGKRWSAWYNGLNEANAYRDNVELLMGGYDSGETDPTGPIDYVDCGVSTRYGTSRLYSSWIDTFSRKWVGPGNELIMDPESPGKLFKYGYIEARVNFSEIVWTIDGHTAKVVSDIDLIPDVYSYLTVSREMNSGVKNQDIDNSEPSDMLEEWPCIPRDPGLYAKNIREFRDRIKTDRAVVDSIKIWQP